MIRLLRPYLLPLLCTATMAFAQSPRNPMQQANDAAEELVAISLAPIGAPLPPSAPRRQADDPVRISGGVMAGQILTRVDPVYPPEARTNKLEGAVVLAAKIGRDGSVEDLSVVSGPAVLGAAALDAVKQWTYRPYLLNGSAVEVRTTVTVSFHLNAMH